MDPSQLVDAPLAPDEPFYDIAHDISVIASLQAFLAGEQPHFDVELLAADQSHTLHVRVEPKMWRPNGDFPDNWVIDNGKCQRLNDDGQPVGPVGSCNGYFITVDAPGHTVGKLGINIPQQ